MKPRENAFFYVVNTSGILPRVYCAIINPSPTYKIKDTYAAYEEERSPHTKKEKSTYIQFANQINFVNRCQIKTHQEKTAES